MTLQPVEAASVGFPLGTLGAGGARRQGGRTVLGRGREPAEPRDSGPGSGRDLPGCPVLTPWPPRAGLRAKIPPALGPKT